MTTLNTRSTTKSQLHPFLSEDGTLLLYITLLVLSGTLKKVPYGAKIHITHVVMSQRADTSPIPLPG